MKQWSVLLLVLSLWITSVLPVKVTQGVEYQAVIDFISIANKAAWKSSFGDQAFPTKAGSRTGSALWLKNSSMENNTRYPLILQTSPDIQENGYMMGIYSNISIPEKARLNAEFGFVFDSDETKGVTFSVTFQTGNQRAVPLIHKVKTYSQQTEKIIVDMSDYANKTGTFILKVTSSKPTLNDQSAWCKLLIEVAKPEKVYPDLIISYIQVSKGEVSYIVKNIGQGVTGEMQRGNPLQIDLILRNEVVATDSLMDGLKSQEEHFGSFRGYRLPDSRAELSIFVCADSTDVIKESEEKNNCLQKKVPPGIDIEDPDLVISRVYVENGRVAYDLKNIGKGSTPELPYNKYFLTTLHLDGKQVALDHVMQGLIPQEEITRTFADFSLSVSKAEQVLVVCADSDRAFLESNEENNCLEKIVPANTEPEEKLRFLQVPVLSNITVDSVDITWLTNKESKSMIHYDMSLNSFVSGFSGNTFMKAHRITLPNLKPGTVYQYYVECADEQGNKIQSSKAFFKTLHQPLQKNSTLRFSLPEQVTGKYVIKPELTQSSDFIKLQLYVDNKPVYANYNPPFEMVLDTQKIQNGLHLVSVVGTDKNKRKISDKREVIVANPDYTLELFPVVEIKTPANDGFEYGLDATNIIISGQIAHPQKLSILQAELLMDGNCIDVLKPDPVKNCWASGPDLPKEFNFSIDIADVSYGKHTMMVKVIDIKNRESSAERTIFVHKPNPKPPLVVSYKTSTSAERTGYKVDFYVINQGLLKAKDITIQIQQNLLPGFLLSNMDKPCQYQLMTDYSQMITIHIPELDYSPNSNSWHIQFDATPVLTQDVDLDAYFLFDHVAIIYDWDDNPAKPAWDNLSISKQVAFDTMLMLFQADYLIVSNIMNLSVYNSGWMTSLNDLLHQMGQLAFSKKGIIGLLEDPLLSADQVKTIIHYWGAYLNPQWNQSGYLLIVGETEIVPAYTAWQNNITTTDYPYASTCGEELIPELAIGRIIGNCSSSLLKPIKASLDVKKGTASFRRNHDPHAKAVCFSGSGPNEEYFWSSASSIGDLLKQEFLSVYKGRGSTMNQQGSSMNIMLRSRCLGISVLLYRDHGGETSWGYDEKIASSDSSDKESVLYFGFGDSRPFIFASCCLAGRYAGIYGIAESFLEKAGAYIGATFDSYTLSNNFYTAVFFQQWINHPEKSLGFAFKETRKIANHDFIWSQEYQFYGDPKFGADPP